MSDVTRLLRSIESGDSRSADQLLPLVYDELRKLAAARMANEQPGQTLQPTALVHEVWIRLAGSNQQWSGRSHFFSAAAEAMRRIPIDQARRKKAQKPVAATADVGVERIPVSAAERFQGLRRVRRRMLARD